nr:unnamed protein product [Spirometra erinaceieuropaei]
MATNKEQGYNVGDNRKLYHMKNVSEADSRLLTLFGIGAAQTGGNLKAPDHEAERPVAMVGNIWGLPKVHKQGVPLRPIVSLRGTPTFGLSKWLYQRLCFLTKDSEWTVKLAEEFLTRIKHLEVEADEVMVSLFTFIPPALAIDTIDGFLREKYDETDQQLKRAHLIELL